MLAWLRSPRGSVTTTILVVLVLLAFGFAFWRGGQHPTPFALMTPPAVKPAPLFGTDASTSQPKKPITNAASEAAPAPSSEAAPAPSPTSTMASNPTATASSTGSTSSAGQPGASVAPLSKTTDPLAAPATNPTGGAAAPSFDVVRVEPTGEAVVAGRGEPGSEVSLVDRGVVVAHMTIDGSGQFALLPPTLGEGEHYLTLQTAKTGQGPVPSSQSVAVSIAKSGTAKPMVAILSPDQPARVLSDGTPLVSSLATAGPSAPVSIQSVEAGQGGQFTASGSAHAGNQCRVYLNGAFLADVTAGKDGRWSVKVEHGMRPGKYTVRADELEAASGKVVNRAEVPFDYPAAGAIGRGKRMLIAKAPPATPSKAMAGAQQQLGATSSSVVASNAPPSASPGLASASPGFGGAASATDGSRAMPGVAGPASTSTALATSGTPNIASPGAARSTDTAPTEPGAASDGAAAAAIVAQLQSATVIRGDSLWRISRKMLGHGVAYTEIYASNATQIRNPNLIYPGQIFVVPNRATN